MAGSLGAESGRIPAGFKLGLFWQLLLLGLLIRCGLALILPPGYDEAYYLFYGKNLSLSYFDHPLAVGLWSWLGGVISRLPTPELSGTALLFALRIPSLLAYTAALGLISDATRRWFGRPAALAALLIGSVSPLLFLCGGLLLLPDSPLLLVLAALLNWLSRRDAILPASAAESLALGGLLGLATLGKYHALLILLAVMACALSRRRERVLLLRPWPWLTIPVWLLVSCPLWIWNASNGWVSFLFHSGRTNARHLFDPAGPLLFLLSQQLLLYPTIGALLLWVLLRPLLHWLPQERFASEQASRAAALIRWLVWPQLILFLLLSGRMQVLASWLVPAWWLLLPLAGNALAALWQGPRRRGVMLSLWGTLLPLSLLVPLAAAQTRWDVLGRWLPAGIDPSGQLMVPEDLRRALQANPIIWSELRRTELIATTRYDLPGFLALAIGPHSKAEYSAFGKDARGFAWWQPAGGFRDQSGVLVLFQRPGDASALQRRSDELPPRLRRQLPSLRSLGVAVVNRNGQPTVQMELLRFGPLQQSWRRAYGPWRNRNNAGRSGRP